MDPRQINIQLRAVGLAWGKTTMALALLLCMFYSIAKMTVLRHCCNDIVSIQQRTTLL